MKSILEIITILVFLFTITLLQKMDEGFCDSVDNTSNTPNPIAVQPANNNKIMVVTASYKQSERKVKSLNSRRRQARAHKG